MDDSWLREASLRERPSLPNSFMSLYLAGHSHIKRHVALKPLSNRQGLHRDFLFYSTRSCLPLATAVGNINEFTRV